jgi:hypothetical protein
MGLVTCPDCGKQISQLAPVCIGCGRPMAQSGSKQPQEVPKTHPNTGQGSWEIKFMGEDLYKNASEDAVAAFNEYFHGSNVKVGKLRLEDDGFLFGSKRYAYDKIIGLYYKAERNTVNFITFSNTLMKLKIVDKSILKVWVADKKSMAKIRSAFTKLRHETFDNRLNYYLKQLKGNGFIKYKYLSRFTDVGIGSDIGFPTSVRIYAQGYIEKRGKHYDLRMAKQSGILSFGAHWRFGFNSSYDPTQIVISEKNTNFARAFRSLRINAVWDTDIIHAIVEALAEGKSLF